jgi:fibronectin-binding autotransporter adhesin
MNYRPHRLLPILALTALTTQLAQTADFYWNPATLSNTWDTTNTFWGATAGSAPTLAYASGATNSAFFTQAGNYTVTIAGTAMTANTVTFGNGGTITLAGAGAVSATGVIVNSGTTLDIAGVANGLFKSGTTALTINGTLTGTAGPAGGRLTQVLGSGILKVGLRWANGSNFAGNLVNNGALGVGLNGNGFAGGTMTLSGDNTGATGDFLVASNTLRLNSTTALGNSFLRLEAGTGNAVLQLAAGDLTRTSSPASAGGGINLSSTGAGGAGFSAIGANRSITLNGGAANGLVWGISSGFNPTALILGDASATNTARIVNGIDLNGAARTFQVNNGTGTLGGELSGNVTGTAAASGLTKTGAGTLLVSGTASYVGPTVLTAGTLEFSANTTQLNGAISGAGNLVKSGASTLKLTGNVTHTGTTTIGTGASLELAGTGYTFASGITGAGNLIKSGTGTINLGGINSYTGTTTITGGSLVANRTTQVALGTGDVSVSSGANLTIQNHAGGGQLPYANNISLSGSGVAGGGALALVNSGAFSMTGTIAISGGTTLRYDPAVQAALPQTAVTFTKGITGSGGLTLFGNTAGVSSPPTFVLTGASTYTGDTVITSSGANTTPMIVSLSGGNDRLPATTNLIFGGTPAGTPAGTYNRSVTLALNGTSQEVAGLSNANPPTTAGGYRIVGANAIASTLVVNNAGANAFAGVLGGAGADENNLNLTKKGAGTLTLNGANTYTGDTTVSEGTLALGATGSIPAANPVSLTGSTAILDLAAAAATTIGKLTGVSGSKVELGTNTLISSTAVDSLFAGDLNGPAGNFTKSGAGNLTLSGNNTAGNVNITGGSLILGSNTALGSISNVTLSGGTLAAGSTTNSAGTLSQTAGTNIIDFANGDGILNFANTGTWAGVLSIWNYTGAVFSPGTDKLTFTSNALTAADLANIQFFSGPGTGLIDAGGAGFIGNELVPGPEPGGALLAGSVLTLAIFHRESRRRRRPA